MTVQKAIKLGNGVLIFLSNVSVLMPHHCNHTLMWVLLHNANTTTLLGTVPQFSFREREFLLSFLDYFPLHAYLKGPYLYHIWRHNIQVPECSNQMSMVIYAYWTEWESHILLVLCLRSILHLRYGPREPICGMYKISCIFRATQLSAYSL